MTNSVLDRVSFDGANLTNVKFVNAVITGSTFKGANLSGSVFEDALIGNEDAKRLCAGLHFALSGFGVWWLTCRGMVEGSRTLMLCVECRCLNPTLTEESRVGVGCRS